MLNKEPKLTEPKVFALLIEFQDTNFISIQSAFSLEEAFVLAKMEFENMQKQIFDPNLRSKNPSIAKISLFTSKTVYELNNSPDINGELSSPDLTPKTVVEKRVMDTIEIIKNNPKIKKVEDKNEGRKGISKLMERIIKDKDFELFKMNKKIFTKSEIKYIENELK